MPSSRKASAHANDAFLEIGEFKDLQQNPSCIFLMVKLSAGRKIFLAKLCVNITAADSGQFASDKPLDSRRDATPWVAPVTKTLCAQLEYAFLIIYCYYTTQALTTFLLRVRFINSRCEESFVMHNWIAPAVKF